MSEGMDEGISFSPSLGFAFLRAGFSLALSSPTLAATVYELGNSGGKKAPSSIFSVSGRGSTLIDPA